MDGKKCVSERSLGSLSKTILDYYTKYGQNRDLEKYLLIRKCRQNSSSGSSVHVAETDEKSCKLSRSLETLSTLKTPAEGTRSNENICQEGSSTKNEPILKNSSAESLSNKQRPQSSKTPRKDKPETAKVKVKNEQKLKKKSFNFNMESNIVISVPTKTDIGIHAPNPSDTSPAKKDFETQTELEHKVEFPQTPIKPMENEPKLEITLDAPHSISPASSLASVSNKHRLEWDSMADVGYEQPNNRAAKSNEMTLSSLEKSGLKQFFAERGLNVNDDIVVIATKHKETDGQIAQNKAEIEEQTSKQTENQLENQTDTKEPKLLWKTALAKYREKYLDESSITEIQITDPNKHSTPMATTLPPKSLSESDDKTDDLRQAEEKVAKHKDVETSCQTSLVQMVSKEIQVNRTMERGSSVDSVTSNSSNQIKALSARSIDEKCPASTGSFEFLLPSAYEEERAKNNGKHESKSSDVDKDSNKENVSPIELKAQISKGNRLEESSSIQPNTSSEMTFSFDRELKEGIDHLNSLLESKAIDRKTKKRMIRKIVLTLLKVKVNCLLKNDTKNPNEIAQNINKLIFTSSSNNSDQESSDTISGIRLLSDTGSETAKKDEPSKDNQMGDSSDAQQINDTMIDWLQPMTHSETDFENHQLLEQMQNNDRKNIESQQREIESKLVDAQDKYLQQKTGGESMQIEWIEKEIQRLTTLKELLGQNKNEKKAPLHASSSDKENKVGKSIVYENILQKVKRRRDAPNQGYKSPKHTTRKSTSSSSDKPKNIERKHSYSSSPHSSWISHPKMLQIAKNRTKLKTPDNDIATYIRSKQQNFVERYEIARGKLYSEEPQLYTQPCSSDHYSEPRSSNRKSMVAKNDAYTSISGSDFFVSSRSVSIPEANSTSNTTTHQYDARTSIAIQTSESVCRTAPIFGTMTTGCNCSWGCSCKKHTIRVKTLKNDKILQATPESIAYTLTFDDKRKRTIKEMNTRSGLIKNDAIDTKPPSSKEKDAYSEKSDTSKITLQERLNEKRPQFVSRAEDRRKCLNEIHSLRLKQNEQRNKLLLLSSGASLRKYLMTEPPASNKRLLASKVFRAQTKQRYNKLPEIRRKDEIDKQNKLRKSQRIVTDMFKKNLQAQVLNGNMNISNSISLIPI